MRIVVTAPTGNVGSHLVPALVHTGVRPVLLMRDPARLDPGLADLVEAVRVDLADRDAVVAAAAGADALYWVTPSVMADDPIAEYRRFAQVACGRLLSSGWSGRVVQGVHGPEDLTWDQAAAIVSDALRRPVRAERISDDRMRSNLVAAGMPDGMAEAVLGMSTGLRDGFVPEVPRSPATTTGTTLGAWAYDVLRPALRA